MDNQPREGSAGGSGAGDSVGSILPSESVLNHAPACGAKGGCSAEAAEFWTRLRNQAPHHLMAFEMSVVLSQQQWHLPGVLITFQHGKSVSITSSSLCETFCSSLLLHNAFIRICSISCCLLALILAKMAFHAYDKTFCMCHFSYISRDILGVLPVHAQCSHKC